MIPIDKEQIRLLEQRLRGIGVDRRTFMKIAGAAMAAPAAGSLLAACGGDDDDDDTAEATNTTTAAAPTATTGGGAQPTATTGAAATATTAAPAATGTTAAPEATATEAVELDADQTLRDIAATQDPASHDFNADLYSGGVAQIWMGLSTYDVDFTPIPGWAESWEPNDDASVWTYHIRPDNTGFSNGDPVTAETFAFSWKRMLIPETAAPYASILFDIKNAQEINLEGADPETLGVRVVDDWTLEVEMVGPRGVFPVIAGYVACVPTHPPSVEEQTAGGGTYSTDPADGPVISNGPFILDAWEHNQSCTLTRNPNYFNQDIVLTQIDWLIVPAEQGMLPYEAGEADYALVPGADLPRIQADATMSQELQKWVEPLIWKILPGTNVEPFDDIELRRAMQHAIDKDRINELTNGGGDPAYCLMPPGLFAYFGEEFKDFSDFSLDKVQEHLAASRYADGNIPSVTMILRNEAQLNSTIMSEDVAAQVLENMGLEIELQIMDLQAFRQLQFENTYELCWIRWFYDYPDPNNGYFDMFYSNKESGKRQAWSNPEFDDFTIQGKEEADPEKRLDIYRECERIMNEDVAYIPIVYRNAYYVYKPWMKGVPVNKQGFVTPNGNIYLGMYDTVYIQGREDA
jgi:ABC-type oligopeptide transport system substrate-binding subunit